MIVVTGAGGKLGRLVADELAKRLNPSDVTLGSRDPAKIADLAAKGFKTARVDFDDSASLEAAFTGAQTVLIVSGDAPNDVRIRQHRAAIDAARKAGVARIVYTSFTNPSAQSLFPFAWIHADTESYLKASGVPFTILRDNQYAENLTNAIGGARSGTLALPGARGKVAYIARADAAAAIAGALTQDGHAGKTYELTGPEALDAFEIAAVVASALARPVQAVDADPAEFGKVFAAHGLPPFVIDALLGLYAAAAAGECAVVSADAAKLAGRPIEPVSAFIRRAAA
jgi:NAD(P)H dehydrogenase (quinone)